MSSPSLYALADQLVRAREPLAFCTVVDTHRSAPREGGARMLVRSDGSIAGTVGGGPLEATVILEARRMLSDAEGPSTRLLEVELNTEAEENIGMKCGGSVRVLVDVHRPAPRVVVLGAGHVGLAVVDAVRVAGWDLLVSDDRPERLALVPEGVERRLMDIESVASALSDVGPSDFVVIVTRCHEVDEKALGAALMTRARYVGLIGSKRKIAVIFKNLREAGLPDPSQDPRVHAPIGLALGGKEPGEIAISIVGELLAVRDASALTHRRLPARPQRETR